MSRLYLRRIGWCISQRRLPFQARVQLGESQSPQTNTEKVLRSGELYPVRSMYLDRATSFTGLATGTADVKDSKRNVSILPGDS